MRRKNAEPLSALLSRYLRREGLETPLLEHRAMAAWQETAGPAVAKLTSDVRMRNSTLYVKVARPALRQELTMNRTRLAQLINQKVGVHVVGQIVFY